MIVRSNLFNKESDFTNMYISYGVWLELFVMKNLKWFVHGGL